MAAALVGSLARLLRAGPRPGRPEFPDTNDDRLEVDKDDVVGITLALLRPSRWLASPVNRPRVAVVAVAADGDDPTMLPISAPQSPNHPSSQRVVELCVPSLLMCRAHDSDDDSERRARLWE